MTRVRLRAGATWMALFVAGALLVACGGGAQRSATAADAQTAARPAAVAPPPGDSLVTSAAQCRSVYAARNARGWRTGVLALGDETLVAAGPPTARVTIAPAYRLPRPLCVRARRGMTTADAVAVLRSATPPTSGFTVLVATGAHDPDPTAYAAGVEAVLARVTTARQVIWVVPTSRDPVRARALATVLQTAARRHPTLKLIGWQSYAATHPGLVAADGAALTTTGATAWANLVGHGVVGSGLHGDWTLNQRTLSTAQQCAAAAASPRGIYLSGDSIVARSLPAFQAAIAARRVPVCLDVWAGRNTRPAAQMAAALPATPRTWLLAIALNDVFPENLYHLAADIERVMAVAGPQRQVVWMEVHVVRSRTLSLYGTEDILASRRVNGLLAAAAARHPNLHVVPWWATARANPALLKDGVHLTAAGEQVYIPRALDAAAAVQ